MFETRVSDHVFTVCPLNSVGSAREGTCAQCSRSRARARMQSALTLVQKLCAQCSLCAHFCAHFSEILAGAQPVLMSTSTKIALKSEHALTFECILAEHECKNALKNEHQCEHLSTSTEWIHMCAHALTSLKKCAQCSRSKVSTSTKAKCAHLWAQANTDTLKRVFPLHHSVAYIQD